MAQVWSQAQVFAPLPAVERGYASILSGHEGQDACLYANGKCIVKRSLSNPYDCETIFMHQLAVGVAKYSPCGNWIASGDAGGCVKVFASAAPEPGLDRAVKNDLPVIGGQVKDLAWAPDGKKIVAVGEGRGQIAKCFAWDKGSTFGEFDGLSRKVNSCDYRPNSPFRIVTGSEDQVVNVYAGPPFKFQLSNKKHTNFVNSVKYSPDGAKFVSVSSDKKCILYDGESGAFLQEFGVGKAEQHTGSILGCAWSPKGDRLITCAADKTVKLWDMQGGLKLVSTIPMGTQVEDMQVGCCWVGDYALSLSLSGHLNYLDLGSGAIRTQVLGHAKPLTTVTADPTTNPSEETFYTSSYDGRVCAWDASAGCKGEGTVHSNMPVKMHVAAGGTHLHSIGFDDSLRTTSLPLGSGKAAKIETCKLDAQPKDSSYCKATDVTAVVFETKVQLFKGGAALCSADLPDASSCAVSPEGSQVAVGTKSGKIFTFAVQAGGGALAKGGKALERHRGEVTAMAYSYDGASLASGDSNREVLVWDTSTQEVKKSRMVYHSSKITCLSWSPDNGTLCSGSVDSNVILWPMDLPTSKRTTLALAHKEGVRGVAFVGEKTVCSVGSDAVCKIWRRTA